MDLVETQMLLGRVELCDRTKTCLVLMNRELSILCTKCHFERLFLFHVDLKDVLYAFAQSI